ncbi:hypothetical protein GCM10007973_20740 [Polymorphobacter multimanifer]|nr:hypothetical protein GCM10007973_20740 [Polymorphobacter multimanifer]
MKIRAALLTEHGATTPFAASAPLTMTALDLAPPGPRELLVRIEAAGLCHSDLSVVNGDRPRPVPMALGHEACATVVAAGPGARLAAGDRVVLAFLPACGSCAACAAGTPWLCAPAAAANGKGELLGGGRRLALDGAAVNHHLGCSAFADYAVVDERSAVKIDADIAPEIAALFGCAVLTGVGAVFNSAMLRPGESVAIWGLGGVGLAALLGAIAAGASQWWRSTRWRRSARWHSSSAHARWRIPMRPRRCCAACCRAVRMWRSRAWARASCSPRPID